MIDKLQLKKQSHQLFFGCAIAFIAALLLLPLGDGKFYSFLSNTNSRLWHLLLAGQATLWAAASIMAFHDRHGGVPSLKTPGVMAGIVLFLAALPSLINTTTAATKDSPLHLIFENLNNATGLGLFWLKLPLMGILGAAAASIQAFGIFYVQERLSTFKYDQDFKTKVNELITLKSRLHRHMYFGGAIIGAVALGIGALRRIGDIYLQLNGVDKFWLDKRSMPLDAVLAYGFYFTIVFAIVCLPALMLLTRTAQTVATEHMNQSTEPEQGTKPQEQIIKEWLIQQKEQKDIISYLGLEASPIESLKTALAVLAPIIGSLTSLLLPGK